MKINPKIMACHWNKKGGGYPIDAHMLLLRLTYPARLISFLDSVFPGIENSSTVFVF
jgi:hypothetical protein